MVLRAQAGLFLYLVQLLLLAAVAAVQQQLHPESRGFLAVLGVVEVLH
jgi:hypothetical protein